MSDDSQIPASANAADLARQLALADAMALGQRKPQATNAPAPVASGSGQQLAGAGISDTAELLRLVTALKQAEADSGAQQRMVVIGEFSVVANRVPASFIGGLGGRDIAQEEFFETVRVLQKAAEEGKPPPPRLLFTANELREVRKLQAIAHTESKEGKA